MYIVLHHRQILVKMKESWEPTPSHLAQLDLSWLQVQKDLQQIFVVYLMSSSTSVVMPKNILCMIAVFADTDCVHMLSAYI